MNIRRTLLVSAAILGLVVACRRNYVVNPPEGPDTEYPCGIHGKSCGDGMCCTENDICGFDGPFSRCPAGYCCYDPPDWPNLGAAPDAGADAGHTPTRQWKAGTPPN